MYETLAIHTIDCFKISNKAVTFDFHKHNNLQYKYRTMYFILKEYQRVVTLTGNVEPFTSGIKIKSRDQ